MGKLDGCRGATLSGVTFRVRSQQPLNLTRAGTSFRCIAVLYTRFRSQLELNLAVLFEPPPNMCTTHSHSLLPFLFGSFIFPHWSSGPLIMGAPNIMAARGARPQDYSCQRQYALCARQTNCPRKRRRRLCTPRSPNYNQVVSTICVFTLGCTT